nr:TonB-dependent receptor [Gemmatimonadaceae bacterium]
WYVYGETRRGNGWRRNGDFSTEAAGANVRIRTSANGTLGLTVSHLDYDLGQPGGLTEAQFAADPRQSRRTRDRFGAPWTVPSITYEHRLGDRTTIDARVFGLVGARNSIGLTTAPTVADSGINPRRVDYDRYRNVGGELRLLHRMTIGGREQVLVGGLRSSRGHTDRVRGRGTDGDAFSLAITADPLIDLDLRAVNHAAFVETQLAVTERLTITPGVRLERIDARGRGLFARSGAGFTPVAGSTVRVDQAAIETVPLAGLGGRLFLGGRAELYGNISSAFRPATFAEQFQNDLVAVDPELRSSRGWSSDLGIRGAANGWLSYDVSGFHVVYGDRIGTLGRAALGADSLRFPNGLRRNIGESRHFGVEAFGEADLFGMFGASQRNRALSVFSSLGWTQAEYVEGPQRGRRVENAPRWVARGGVSTRLAERLAGTLQVSHVSGVFSDANNTRTQADGQQGWIPSYVVWDLTGSVRVARGAWLDVSVNNLFDRAYFTRRATGYPGPGIIPADGRLVTAGLRLDWTTLVR